MPICGGNAETDLRVLADGRIAEFVHDKWSRYRPNLDDLARIITDPRSAQIFK
jgi:hypothetical protein